MKCEKRKEKTIMKSKRITEEKWRVSVYFSNRGVAESFRNLLESCNYTATEVVLVTDPVSEGRMTVAEVLKNGVSE